MARKKSYSSELAHIYDGVILLAQEIKNFQETISGVIADSEKYQEIKPILYKLGDINTGKSPDGISPDKEQPTTELPHDEPLPDMPEVKKRIGRAKKIIETGTPPTDT